MKELNEMRKIEIEPEEASYILIEKQIHTFLEALPLSEHSVPLFHLLDSEIGAIEATIKKTNAFIHFLSKLNPMQYFRWMKAAFSSYVATTQLPNERAGASTHVALPAASEHALSSTLVTSLSPKKKTKTTKKKHLTPS